MRKKIAINGLGRIGRLILRHYLANPPDNIEIIAANDLTPIDEFAYLIRHDSVHGNSPFPVEVVQQWAQFVKRPEVRAHVVFLEDYDMALAQQMVQGVDVWINTPRRPWEACGTSGMKVLVNGGLNISELDGWWAEAYDEEVGWSIGDGKEHPEPGWDDVEAEELYRLLEEEVIPEFYKRDATGIPHAWVARMRASMMRLAPHFSTNRMMKEYVEKMYLPAATAYERRIFDDARLAGELRNWELTLRQHWQGMHWGNLEVHEEKDGWSFDVQVYLGGISPDFVQVQIFADPVSSGEPVKQEMERRAAIPGSVNGYHYYSKIVTQRPATDFTQRIIPSHGEAIIPTEMDLIFWRSA